jgi:hypothetical protein
MRFLTFLTRHSHDTKRHGACPQAARRAPSIVPLKCTAFQPSFRPARPDFSTTQRKTRADAAHRKLSHFPPHRRFRPAVVTHGSKSNLILRYRLRAAFGHPALHKCCLSCVFAAASPQTPAVKTAATRADPPIRARITGLTTSEISARRSNASDYCRRICRTSTSRRRRRILQRRHRAPPRRERLRSFVSIPNRPSLPPLAECSFGKSAEATRQYRATTGPLPNL